MHRLQQVTRHLVKSAYASHAQFPTAARRMMSTHATGAESEPAPVRITPHANGCLTLELRRPKALNSLSTPMVRLLTRGLRDEAARAGKTKCVLVYGEGEKAFCAGGDIRALAFPSEPFEPSKFFREEYTLNHLVATFPAPYVAIMRGITMGGGVGISVHGHVRIVTDNTMFAMPETGIGLYPDVGGSYFMPRLPGAIGMYLALTGQSIGAVDSMYAGVGTHFVPLASITALIHELETSQTSLDSTLQKYASAPPADTESTKLKSFLSARRALIDRVFVGDSYAEVTQNLARAFETSQDADEKKWIESVQKQLATKSPTSLMVTFESQKRGATLPLADCLSMEFRLSTRISLEGGAGDFAEGVKAIVVDKKHKPVWKPFRTVEQIRDTYFSPLSREGIEEFNLKK